MNPYLDEHTSPSPTATANPTEAASSLRVLFISHAYVVGVNQGKLAAIAATGDDIGGVTVGLLAPSNWQAPEWKRRIPVEQPYPSIQVYTAPVQFSGRGGAHFYSPWTLWRVIADFRPDIIQVEEEVFSLVAFEVALCCRLRGIPLVVFGWENLDRTLPLPRRWTCQLVLDTAPALIPGNTDGARLLRKWGYRKRLEVMPQMGVDTELFQPNSTPQPTQAHQGNAPLNIGFLGRLVPEKGLDTLFAAAQQLQDQGLDFTLTLYGTGSAEADLRRLAQQQQISDRVHWPGAIRHEQAPAALSQFDVLVLPSVSIPTWKEQFGHVLIEAMAMGVPVVGSDCGEIPHVIGRADLVFAEGDATGLTVILAKLITDSQWRAEVGEYGLERVQRLYSHQRIAERSLQLWRSVLALQ